MSFAPHILLAESDPRERAGLVRLLEAWGYRVTSAPDGREAVREVAAGGFALLLALYELPGGGTGLLESARAADEALPVLFMSHSASVDEAVNAMKAGAVDFVLRPVEEEALRLHVKRALGEDGDGPARPARDERKIVTADPAMDRLLALARQVADSAASVLIQGESGTGKELFARYLHAHSGRSKGPFVAINCGALPENLLESELFGYEKGAFTGAAARKKGRFELAEGGTILLDEVTEMQPHLQSKLLRVLQEREVDRVGGVKPVKIDARVLATTNRDVAAAVDAGDFRQDLYYRLNVIPLHIPPLRNRPGDVLLLARHFIEKYNEIDNRAVKGLTPAAESRLVSLPYKGNVRELENIIERAVLLAAGERIDAPDLFIEPAALENAAAPAAPEEAFEPGAMPLKEVERKVIFSTLDKTSGNRTHAAKLLGISVRTLRNKLNEYKDGAESA